MQKIYWRQRIYIFQAQIDGLTDEERPTDDDSSLINKSDIEIGNAVRGTKDAKNTVEENSTGLSNINQTIPIHDINDIAINE